MIFVSLFLFFFFFGKDRRCFDSSLKTMNRGVVFVGWTKMEIIVAKLSFKRVKR